MIEIKDAKYYLGKKVKANFKSDDIPEEDWFTEVFHVSAVTISGKFKINASDGWCMCFYCEPINKPITELPESHAKEWARIHSGIAQGAEGEIVHTEITPKGITYLKDFRGARSKSFENLSDLSRRSFKFLNAVGQYQGVINQTDNKEEK